jgi:response regulator RpfG family c-di-GMP phosphodiesterase
LYAADNRSMQKMAPMLQRILIIDSNVQAVRMMSDLLRSLCAGQYYTANAAERGLLVAQQANPQVIFVEQQTGAVDAAAFTRALRRSDLACRQAPVIVVTAETTAGTIIAARDAGAHEFLRKPYTIKDLMRRLEAVTLHPRDWVEAVAYIGPDRRRFNSGDYKGPRKRKSDANQTPDRAKMLQALKIVRAAALAVDSDPMQARRALAAQAYDLQKLASASSDINLSVAAADLARCVRPDQPLTLATLRPYVTSLLAFLPPEELQASAARAAAAA